MSKEVHTVGDLSGKHVGVDTVRIEHGASVIEGVITALTISTDSLSTLGGDLHYVTRADIKIGEEFYLSALPMHAPASIVTRSDPQ